jgi:hypothetical protein
MNRTVKPKELQLNIQQGLNQLLEVYEIGKPSKRTVKLIEKSSKRISRKLADELRKELKKLSKVRKAAAKKNTLEERAA